MYLTANRTTVLGGYLVKLKKILTKRKERKKERKKERSSMRWFFKRKKERKK
jgi:hypothetical protein